MFKRVDYKRTLLIVIGVLSLMRGCVLLAQQHVDVGQVPNAVAAGDFNGDGILDFAVTNCAEVNVSILLGQKDGGFIESKVLAGVFPASVAAGDFNGDGHTDLAVANNLLNNVAILLGRGDGTFTRAYIEPFRGADVGGRPFSVAVGDFNGDNKQDLAVANSSSDTVSILLGKGNGTFDPARHINVGNRPLSVVVGDFNGDGVPDLAVANGGSNSVSILIGNKDRTGTFKPVQELEVGRLPFSIAIGDFNGDGAQDLAVANANSRNVSILIGHGNGKFRPAQNFGVPRQPWSVAVADLDGDKIQDLVVTSWGYIYREGESGAVAKLKGRGDGTFEQAEPLAEDIVACRPIFVRSFGNGSSPYLVMAGLSDAKLCPQFRPRKKAGPLGSFEGAAPVPLFQGEFFTYDG